MKRILLLVSALLAIAVIFRTSAVAGAKQAPLRALMVCGGCCHDYANQKKILSEGISARANVEWTIVQEDAPTGGDARDHRVSIYEKPQWWKGCDVIVHNECFTAARTCAANSPSRPSPSPCGTGLHRPACSTTATAAANTPPPPLRGWPPPAASPWA